MAGGIELAPLVTKIKVDVASFKRDMDKAAAEGVRAAKDMENKMSNTAKIGKAMTGIGDSMTKKVTVPLVGAGIACAKFYLDAETSFSKVSTIIDTGVISMDRVKDKVIEASNETGVAVTDFNEALYQSVSAGVDSGKAIDFTTQMVQLARGGFTTTTSAVDVVTTALNAYGLEADQATAVSDKLITTQNLGKTTVDELASSMGKIIPTADAYNVNLDQLCTGMAPLTSNGIQTAEATTYFNSMLNELGKSGTQASTVLQEKTGKSFAELQAEGASLTDVLAILKDEAENNGLALGDMFGSAEAGKAALSLMGDEGEKFNDILGQMEGSAGATQEAFDKMNADPAQQLATAVNELKNAGILMGQALAPVIETVAEGISGFATAFQNLSPETKEFIAKTGLMVAAAGPLLSITGRGITLFTRFTPLIRGVSTAIGALTGKKKLLSGAAKGAFNILKANPYVAVAAGAATLAAGIYAVYTNLNEETIAAKKSVEANKERIETIELQNEKTDYYAQKLEELSSKEEKSAQDKQMIQSYVDLLNGSVEGLNLTYDAEADKLSQTTDEIRKKIDAMKDEALQAAYIEHSKKALEDYTESQIKLTEAQEHLEEVQKRYDEAAANGYVSQQMSTDLAKAKAEVKDLTGATSTYWTEYVSQSNKAFKASGQWDDLLKEAGKTGKDLPEALKDGINEGKYVIPQTVDELNGLISFVKMSKKAAKGGKELVDSLTAKMQSQEIDVKTANEVLNNAIDFKKAAKTAGVDGQAIIKNLAGKVDSGKITVQEANNRLNEMIEFTKAVEEADMSGTDIVQKLTTKIRNGKLTASEAAKQLTSGAENETKAAADRQKKTGNDFTGNYTSSIQSGNTGPAGKHLTSGAEAETNAAAGRQGGIGSQFGGRFSLGIAGTAGIVRNSGVAIGQAGLGGANSVDYAGGGHNDGKGYASGLRKAIKAVARAGRAIAEAALEAAKKRTEQRSPSRAWARSAALDIKGYTQQMMREIPHVKQAGRSVAEAAMEGTRISKFPIPNTIEKSAIFQRTFALPSNRKTNAANFDYSQLESKLTRSYEEMAKMVENAVERGLKKMKIEFERREVGRMVRSVSNG